LTNVDCPEFDDHLVEDPQPGGAIGYVQFAHCQFDAVLLGRFE
jgi:hypothetical protein